MRLLLVPIAAFALHSEASTTLHAQGEDSFCAVVRVQLQQELVLTRTVFTASFQLDNGTTSPLEDVELELTFTDEFGFDGDLRFAVGDPELAGFFGLGMPLGVWGWELGDLVAGASGQAVWEIQPQSTAAPTEAAVRYDVGGTLRYSKNGSPIVVPLLPQRITVHPNPSLRLAYYWQDTVYSDDPFTEDVIEPTEPFSIGLRVLNDGPGTAREVRIRSFEDLEIVENLNGLAVAFQIVGAEVDGASVPAGAAQLLGDLPPSGSAVVRWLMTSSLRGTFDNFSASFVHRDRLNGVGGESLIESVVPFPLVHVADLGAPASDDCKPDFLVDSEGAHPIDPFTGLPVEDFPDRMHLSSGEELAVQSILVPDEWQEGPPSRANVTVQVQLPIAYAGWKYLRLSDLGAGIFNPRQITRTGPGGRRSWAVAGSGGVSQVWRTVRPVSTSAAPAGPPEATQYSLHLVDYFPAGGDYVLDLSYLPALRKVISTDIDTVSLAGGATVNFTLTTPEEYTGSSPLNYQVIGSLSEGSGPMLRGHRVPFLGDGYTRQLLGSRQAACLVNFRGVLREDGATASLVIEAGSMPELAGLELFHSCILWSREGGIVSVSDPVRTFLRD